MLIRNAARKNIELPDIVYGKSDPDFLWRAGNDGNVVLSVTGLSRSSAGRNFAEQFLRVVLRCRDIYLNDEDESENPPKVTSEDLKSIFGFDDCIIRQVHEELQLEYFLTRGGVSASKTEWYFYINHQVQKFRDVETLDQYIEERAKLVLANVSIGSSFATSLGIASNLGPKKFSTESGAEGDLESNLRNVFVVFGRDLRAKDALWEFLEALGLHPLNWNEMVRMTGQATPYTGQVIEAGFDRARVCVVLLTPDDEARLHKDLLEPEDPTHEHVLTCQPRPNVMFEAGRAFATHPNRTIIVEIGAIRQVSDLAGLNVVRIGPTKAPLKALADRLEAAGCPIDRSNGDAFDASRFVKLSSRNRKATSLHSVPHPASPVGRVIPPPAKEKPIARLDAKIWERGRSRLLEIVNRGDVEVLDVHWETVGEAPNWNFHVGDLPNYPITSLGPHRHVRVPVFVGMGGPVYIDLRLLGHYADGVQYEEVVPLSVFG